MNNLPRVLVLTGLPGSGKSFVGKVFEAEGAIRLDADVFARQALDLTEVKKQLPQDCLKPDGSVDRIKLRERFLVDKAVLQLLEQAIHPQVRVMFEKSIQDLPAGKLVVYELPLLFEKNITHPSFFKTACTTASEACIRGRLLERGLDDSSISRLLALHLSQGRKAELSDMQINTECSESEVVTAVQKIYKTLVT